jgi:hypothetical protein
VADVDLLVLDTVNASWRRAITAPTLLACLRGEGDVAAWPEHLRTFFEEVPREAMLRRIVAHRLPADRMLALYRALFAHDERGHDGIEAWLTELADAA